MTALACVACLLVGWLLCWATQSSQRRTRASADVVHADYVRRTLEAAQREANLSAAIRVMEKSTEAATSALTRQTEALDALDRTVGNVLASLLSAGVIRSVALAREEQVGESPITRETRTSLLPDDDEGAIIPPAGSDELR